MLSHSEIRVHPCFDITLLGYKGLEHMTLLGYKCFGAQTLTKIRFEIATGTLVSVPLA